MMILENVLTVTLAVKIATGLLIVNALYATMDAIYNQHRLPIHALIHVQLDILKVTDVRLVMQAAQHAETP